MDISIITPCFNHGQYLNEAIDSIEAIETLYTYEHIIINDGSTDEFTLKKLLELEQKGHHVIHQNNQGLACARNNGIAIAQGKYIIPLDSDNKLHKNYLTKAIDVLEQNSDIDVVFADSILFGVDTGVRKITSFAFEKMINENYIDACAVLRKKTFLQTGGYDKNMPAMGNEDWEMWIHIYLNNGNFFYLNDVGFYYRILPNSMTATTTGHAFVHNREYIQKKHAIKIIKHYQKDQRIANNKLLRLKKNRLKSALKILLGLNI